MSISKSWFSGVLVFFFVVFIQGRQETLDQVLHHYETLHRSDIHHDHHVTKRRADNERLYHDKIISFNTLGKEFTLHLTSNLHLFTSDFTARVVLDGTSEEIAMETEQFYTGYVADDVKSKVTAYWEGDDLVARIRTSGDTYVIEPLWRHLNTSGRHSMLAYRASDIKNNTQRDPKHHVSRSTCGWVRAGVDVSIGHHNPIVDANSLDGVTHVRDSLATGKKRYRRQARSTQVCSVALVADYRFTKNVGDNSFSITAKYLAGVMATVNSVYESTDFGNGYAGTGFEIRGIIVYRDPSSTPEFNQDVAKWATQPLLESFGKEDWSPYCLSHLFTYQAFDGGVQGLGWIASSNLNEIGGICSPRYNNLYYNTAWTSHQNAYGSRILAQEADLVTSHEFGHNWGSPHDQGSSCTPGVQSGGKYLMYQYAVSGYDPNNNVFSSCSRSSMGSVLAAKASNCFTERNAAYCGNFAVESGEECDAGTRGRQGLDSCCTSQCSLLKTAQCSDMNSPCCSSCQYQASTVVCRTESKATCQAETSCSGTSGECPAALPLAAGSECVDLGTCQNGQCTPLCESNGFVSCSCDNHETQACEYCCRASSGAPCQPYTGTGGADAAISLPDGRSCYQGYCEAGTCIASNVDNTARLWDVIKNFNINAILKWMKNNVVIATIVISLVLYIPLCLIVFCIDRRIAKKEKEEREWLDKNNDKLIKDGDDKMIRRTRPRRRNPRHSNYATLGNESEASVSNVDYRPGQL